MIEVKEVINQRDEPVLYREHILMVECRHAANAQADNEGD